MSGNSRSLDRHDDEPHRAALERGHEPAPAGLRGAGGSHDTRTNAGEDFVTWVGVSLRIGEDGGSVSSGTALMNLPSP